MGGRARAGCPVKNIQATLDGLTDAGLSVAVFEEINDVDVLRGPKSKKGIKTRALTQIISPSSRTYIYDLCLRSDDIEFREGRPVVGIHSSATGYSVCEIYSDQRVLIISERLSKEATRSLLDFTGPTGTIYVQQGGISGKGKRRSEFDFLSSLLTVETLSGYSPEDFHAQVPSSLCVLSNSLSRFLFGGFFCVLFLNHMFFLLLLLLLLFVLLLMMMVMWAAISLHRNAYIA